MKKLTVLLVALLASSTMFAQTCIDDAWQCLRQNQAPKAKKFIESCMEAYPDNAQVWLMKANVYVSLYNSEQAKLDKDPNYVSRYPDALMIANEAFVKALQLDKNVQPKTNMLGAIDGQRLCAEPIYQLGIESLKKGDYQKALDYFTLAAKNFELGKSSTNAAMAYVQAALIYRDKLNDKENSSAMFAKAIANKKDFADAYVELYYLYLEMNDTVRCGTTIENALKNVPADKQNSLAEPMMNYYSMTNQGEKLLALCDTVILNNPKDVNMAAVCANYLSNYKSFAKAEEILNKALAAEPNNFKLNEQMGYRYYEEMQSLEEQAAQYIKDKKYNEAIALRNSPEMKDLVQKGYEWANKAYNIDPDHLDNMLHLRQLMVKLGMTVPQELNDKINARQR
ncbi:MAG: hypothetical protein MJZ87_06690 [Bacteroidales bacterium]|nr:hypothetical protein [Bacteroidales bacterium]